jgi:hypothetical protein
MKDKNYWLWENEEFQYPLEKIKDNEIYEEGVEFYKYNFELSQNEIISEDTTLLFKMIDKITKNVFFLTGTLFCSLDIKESFKIKVIYEKDKKEEIIDSDEVCLKGSDFRFQDLTGYLDHYYYFDNYKILPLTEPNNEYFDDGFVDTSKYGFLGIYESDKLNKLINNFISTK